MRGITNENSALLKRFLSKVRVSDTGCWLWTGAKSRGYGLLSKGWKKTPYKAHRLSYEIFVGELSPELVVRHKCDTPACVNPDHLEVGTQAENMRDASLRGRLNPVSLNNLCPGAHGYVGAGPVSRGHRLGTSS